jgi:hypothetical protein
MEELRRRLEVLFNARERSEGDWRKLIADADESGRFKVVGVLRSVRASWDSWLWNGWDEVTF